MNFLKQKGVKEDSAARGRRIAAIGDLHGCIKELTELYNRLQWLSLDEIWCLGDLVDRGPDSGGVIAFLRENKIPSVKGNHDDSICNHYKRFKKKGEYPKNKDKKNTIKQLTDADYEYLVNLPAFHVFNDIGLILVHGGIWPKIPLYAQPKNVIRAQLIKPPEYGAYKYFTTSMIETESFGSCRWWGKDATLHRCKKTEEESYKEGWRRWYHVYDHVYDCCFGHSVFNQPMIHQNEGCGRTVGIDQGSVFGGSITAGIFDGNEPHFMSVRVRKCYTPEASRVISDE
jgi:predicted phosphodiesterase